MICGQRLIDFVSLRSRLGATSIETLRIAKCPDVDVEVIAQIQTLVLHFSHSSAADQDSFQDSGV